MRKIIGSILLALGMVLSVASMATASNGGQEHREIVCHKTGNGYIPIPPDKASSHITSEGESERGHTGDFLLKVTYDPKVDGKWSEVKDRFRLLCNGSTPTVTTVVPGPIVTVTKTKPPVTKTVKYTPTVTVTKTAEVPVTETKTVVPTNTVTTTAPAVVETVTVTPTNTTTVEATPKEVIKTVGSGRVVTKLVDSKARVVAVEQSYEELPYTGINMTYLYLGIIMVLLGTVLLMGRKLMLVRS